MAWTIGMVCAFVETYPRGWAKLAGIIGIDEFDVSRWFIHDRIDWRCFKRLLKTCEALTDDQIAEQWECSVERD